MLSITLPCWDSFHNLMCCIIYHPQLKYDQVLMVPSRTFFLRLVNKLNTVHSAQSHPVLDPKESTFFFLKTTMDSVNDLKWVWIQFYIHWKLHSFYFIYATFLNFLHHRPNTHRFEKKLSKWCFNFLTRFGNICSHYNLHFGYSSVE